MMSATPAPIMPVFVRFCPVCRDWPMGTADLSPEVCETCRADLTDRFARPDQFDSYATLGDLMIRCHRNRLAAVDSFGMRSVVGPEAAIKFRAGSPEEADLARLGGALDRVDGVVATVVPTVVSVNYPFLTAHLRRVRDSGHDPFAEVSSSPFHLLRNTVLEFAIRYEPRDGVVGNAHGYDPDGVPLD